MYLLPILRLGCTVHVVLDLHLPRNIIGCGYFVYNLEKLPLAKIDLKNRNCLSIQVNTHSLFLFLF